MRIKGVKENAEGDDEPNKVESEKDLLIEEKIELSTKLGIWGSYNPIPNYQDTEENKRIAEINKRLGELVK